MAAFADAGEDSMYTATDPIRTWRFFQGQRCVSCVQSCPHLRLPQSESQHNSHACRFAADSVHAAATLPSHQARSADSPAAGHATCYSIENLHVGSLQSCSRATCDYSYSSVTASAGCSAKRPPRSAAARRGASASAYAASSRACRSLARANLVHSCIFYVRLRKLKSGSKLKPKP